MSDLVVLHEVPDSKHGKRPEDRSIEERIHLGVAIVDKPAGPTSHQVSAWVRDMFGVPKAGHSGTLDPRVTGVLPVALADATRAVEAVLEGDKEYVGVMQLHQDVDERRVRSMMGRFVGEVYQMPPVRSAVKREQRTRHVYELEPLEVDGRNVLFRVRCESGTYIRTLCADIGDALGVGANLVDLRRTRAATFGVSPSARISERPALPISLTTTGPVWMPIPIFRGAANSPAKAWLRAPTPFTISRAPARARRHPSCGSAFTPNKAITPSPVNWLTMPPLRLMASPTASKYLFKKNTRS